MTLAEPAARSRPSLIGESIYVIHAFQKKSKAGIATPKAEMDLIRQRLKQLRSEVTISEAGQFILHKWI